MPCCGIAAIGSWRERKAPEQTLANGDIKFMKARTFVAA